MLAQLISPEFWQQAAVGAVAGAVLSGAWWLFREKERIAYRFRRSRRIARGETEALLEPEEYEGYLALSLSEEERGSLPVSMIFGSLWAGISWASWQTGNIVITGVLMIGLSLYGVIKALSADRSNILEIGDTDEEYKNSDQPSRGQALAFALLGLFGAVIAVPDFAGPILNWFSLSEWVFYRGIWMLVMIGLVSAAILRLRDAPPDHLEGDDLEQWRMLNMVLLICAAVIAVGLVIATLE